MAGMNTAKFAIVIAETPTIQKKAYIEKTGVQEDVWKYFQANTPRISDQIKGIEKLDLNMWQIDLTVGLTELSKIVLAADEAGIAIRVLFLEEVPMWLQYPAHEPKELAG